MKKITVLFFATVTFLSGFCQKQWTLQECIDYALANNISLLQNKISAAQSEVSVEASKAALLPGLSFSTNQSVSNRPFSSTTSNLTNGTMTTSSNTTNYSGNYGINANWTVWNGGQNVKNIRKSEMSKQIADLATEQTANTIQERIAQLYIQILYVAEAVKVDSSIVNASILQRDRAKEMVNVGSLAKVDLAQLEAQVTQDQYSLIRAQSQLQNYKLQLKQLLEIQGAEQFDVITPVISDASVLAPVPNKNAIYETALSIRPEIQSGKLNITASQLDEKIAKAGYMPTISMNASVGSSTTTGTSQAWGNQMRKNLSNNVSVGISVPIFDKKQTKSAVSRAKLETQDRILSLQDSEKKLYSDIENYWLNATTSQRQYISAKNNVKSMEESYSLVSEQFKVGLKNIVELTTGKNNLLQAKQQMLESKYTALYNLAMLRFFEGQSIKL